MHVSCFAVLVAYPSDRHVGETDVRSYVADAAFDSVDVIALLN